METLSFTKEQLVLGLSKYADAENGFQTVLQLALDSLMKSERKLFLREHPDNKGNGYRPLHVFGHGRMLELQIPRDRLSQFKPLILAIYRSQEEHLKEVIFQLYSKGLTTRDISDVMDTLYGGHYSKSKISVISQNFYKDMEAWRNRPLHQHYKVLYIDGTFVKVCREGHYENECYYIILGLNEDNTREILSIVNFPTESATSWELIFESIRARGVQSVGLIVSDALNGVDVAIARKFPGTHHQKCCVHLMRNLMSYVRGEDKKLIAIDLKKVLDISNPYHNEQEALKQYREMAERWKGKYKSLERYLYRLDITPYLTCLRYDYRIRNMIYATNWIERFNRMAKRTLKVRGAMPDDESVLALITSVAIEATEGVYRYPLYIFDMEQNL